ncbi:ras guanine nucleotide exchange factor domain-containing protein, partial [Mycotypha africana]|uniref:ras guanine nucleotide exchange factor domain-containing protein n=1 Tax=Mycotypha africana TaxID=64632 RepID=UPI002301C91A
DVLLESIVNPRNLMPAQTSTGDSLTLPTLSLETDKNNNSSDNYVPNIPAPPLLATHKRIQQLKCARQTLEKVRSLYMSAMTIPSIMHFPPHLIAYQLTLIESSIFCAIPREALLTHSSRTPHKKIVASTDFFNYTTRFIEHSILLPQEAYRRAEIIHRWIKIATKLYLLHNYQTLKAVVSALGTPPIKRLRRTWDCIPKKKMAKLEMLSHLMSETDNYQKYREHIQVEQNTCSWTKPIVPFLGVFIHDVTYLYAANRRVLEVLHQIQMFQKAPKYPPYPIIDENNHSVTLPRGRKKKNLFRPIDALHFVGGNSSRKDHNNNGSTIFGAATAALMLGDEERMEPQQEVEVEQQLITQYLLMRPWVNEKTIDALSNLREPMNKPRSSSSPTTVTTAAAAVNASGRYNSSRGFWPFRKSNDMSRQLYVEPASGSGRDFAITNSWSEVDDDDDDDDEDSEDKEYKDTLDEPMTTPSISRNDNSGSLNMRLRFPSVASSNNRNSSNIHTKGHSRSFSLPA